MPPLPRIALGTVEPNADCTLVLWALLEALRGLGLQVQSFLSRACFANYHGAATTTGRNPRHLDSWLMSADLCREVFVHGAEDCDLAVVQGEFAGAVSPHAAKGGSLDPLCQWLDLPRVVVLDASQTNDRIVSEMAPQADALLLDRLGPGHDLAGLAAELEARWGIPVLGGLAELSELRSEISALPAGTRPARELSEQLGSQFLRQVDPRRLLELGLRRELPPVAPRLFRSDPAGWPLAVALAYDEAFNCYFPDALDCLEMRGATLLDFSPLRDERLPPGTDIVYLGCGHPERYAAELSQNHCMKLALRSHLCSGGRIYAEGGGLAYLCQHIRIAEGELWRMVGVFPAIAQLIDGHTPPAPVEATLARDTWLCPSGSRLRGYRNPCWQLQPTGALGGCLLDPQHQCDLVMSRQAIGSQLHLSLAAQPDLLAGFLRPHVPQPDPGNPWT